MIQLKIILNMLEKNATDDEIYHVAKIVLFCEEFISNLPNKYETLIGEKWC